MYISLLRTSFLLNVLLAPDNRGMIVRVTLRSYLIEVYVAHHIRTAFVVVGHVILQAPIKDLVARAMKPTRDR
jgi:hypothetical protein